MSATEELRRLLDERGVEWACHGYENHTWWNGGGVFGWHAENRPSVNGSFVKIGAVITPEQAIAATLGETYTREECEAAFVRGYSLGSLPVGSSPQWDENRQTVDGHMAELGWVRAATLGGGKLTADDVRDLIERHSDASGGNGRDFHNGAYVAIADELNAALGGGECKWAWVESWTDTTDGRECDYAHWMPDCGCWSEYDYRFNDFDDYAEKPIGIAFCERCGKAVKR